MASRNAPRPPTTIRAARSTSLRRRAVTLLAATAIAVQPLLPASLGIRAAVAQALPTQALPSFGKEAPPEFTRGLPGITTPGSFGSPSQALPDLGDESQALLTPVQEKKLGESVVRQIRAQGGWLDDPEVNDYLQNLGQRLVAAVPDARIDFVFFAVPDSGINAFALPGGYIGVNTGLILLAQNESELAAVLAHEISHITQHHLTRMMSAQKGQTWLQLAALALAIAMSRGGGTTGAQGASAALAGAQALAMQTQLNFTREHEYEADRIGFQRLDAAGFDVNAMATFMERLQRATRFADNASTPSYLRTHPITYERIAEAQARAQSRPYRQVADSLDFHLVRALLKSYTGTSKDAVAFFDYSIAERKYNNQIAAHYGLVASLLRAADYKRAKVELATLEKMAPPHPMIDAMAAHVYLDAGDIDLAVKRFEAALARYPNKMQLIYDYPDALIAANRTKDAIAFVERELARFPGDGRLHRTAAKAYASLGNRMQQHRHQAEYYAWQGDLKGAVTQLELAVKAGDGDFYQASVVETRLRALRQELQDQQKANTRNG